MSKLFRVGSRVWWRQGYRINGEGPVLYRVEVGNVVGVDADRDSSPTWRFVAVCRNDNNHTVFVGDFRLRDYKDEASSDPLYLKADRCPFCSTEMIKSGAFPAFCANTQFCGHKEKP